MGESLFRIGIYIQEWIDGSFIKIFELLKVSKDIEGMKLILENFYNETKAFLEENRENNNE